MCTWQSVSRETGMFQSTVPAWCVQFSKPFIACRPPFVHHFFIRKMGPEKIEHCFRHVTHHDFPRFPPKKSSNFQVSNFSIHSGGAKKSVMGLPNPSSPRAFAKKVTHTQLPTSSFKASFYLVFYQCSQKRSNTVENFWNVGGWKLIGYPFLSWGESPSGHASE